jgi:hypothetical protein
MAMSPLLSTTRIAVADHLSIGAEARQRNSHKPSQQVDFTKLVREFRKAGMAFRSASTKLQNRRN